MFDLSLWMIFQELKPEPTIALYISIVTACGLAISTVGVAIINARVSASKDKIEKMKQEIRRLRKQNRLLREALEKANIPINMLHYYDDEDEDE